MKRPQSMQSDSRKKVSGKKQSNKRVDASSMLREFFVEELKDIYWAEKHLLKVLPKMEKAATTEELQQAINEHTRVTEEQVKRLERTFELLGERAQGKRCEGMEGITNEGKEIIDETEEGSLTRDVALIIAAQKVEHYEIAAYGGLAQLARTLGETEVASLLEETLDEEKETDKTLTVLAEENINENALVEEEEEWTEEE